jgi:DegV family protein with EDD domain
MLIVTDAAVDIPETLARSDRARVVSGEVWLGDKPFRGDSHDFWKASRAGVVFSTTPPSVNALIDAYRYPDLVVALHVSARLSATVARAHEACQRAGAGVVVVDTRSLSVGAGLLATAVDRATRDPIGTTSVIDVALGLPERLHTFVIVQDVSALQRSGRAGLVPEHRREKGRPVLAAVRGRTVVLDQPKDRTRALRHLAAHAKHSSRPGISRWALGHGDAYDLDDVTEELSHSFGSGPEFVMPIGPTVGAHVGVDAVVVGVMTESAYA